MRGDYGKLISALVREAEAAINKYGFAAVYRILKEFTGGRKSFDGCMGDINVRLVIHGDEQLKRWSEHFTMIFNCITYDKVPSQLRICPSI